MSFTPSQIAEWSKGRIVNVDELGARAGEIRVERPSPLAASRSSDLAFLFSKAYAAELPSAQPGILIVGEDFVEPLRAARLPLWTRCAVIACKDPYWSMAVLSGKFAE